MRTSLLFLLCVLYTFGLKAAPVDTAAARRAADLFFASQSASTGTVRAASTDQSTVHLETFPQAFMATKGERFLLIHRDDELPEVLGYGTFSSEKQETKSIANASSPTLPPVLRSLLTAKSIKPTNDVSAIGTFRPVAPLLSTVRHQSAPYNALCPYYLHSDGTLSEARCIVGCVATAMEQILTYHRKTYTLQDTLHGWQTEHYTISDVLPDESVDTRIILDNYDTQTYTAAEADAVARLSYWLGVASHMQWGLSSSGTNSYRLVKPLRSAFGLPYVHYLEAYKYDPTAYWQFIANEIMACRPVYYAGAIQETGGHAFVLDGLDNDGLFHVNWGYGGEFDGFFRLDVLWYAQPEADRKDRFVYDGFFSDQEAIAVGTEEVADALLPDTLQRTGTDVAIDSVSIRQTPATNRFTAVDIHVRNASSTQTFYTSFALLQNEPTDTATIAQAEWLAMSAATLKPGETTTLRFNAMFTHAGPLTLSVTTDGKTIMCPTDITVAEGSAVSFSTDVPEVEIHSDRSITVHQPITNNSPTERASKRFQYELHDETSGTQWRLGHYVYLAPSETLTDTMTFRGLTAGHSYTLYTRERWPIVQTVQFTMPGTDSITPEIIDAAKPEKTRWYTLSGILLSGEPTQQGIYLKCQGTKVTKVFVGTNNRR